MNLGVSCVFSILVLTYLFIDQSDDKTLRIWRTRDWQQEAMVTEPFKEVCTYGPRHVKTCLRWFANNTGADQPALQRRLISGFVIRVLECIVSQLATSEILI